MACMNLFTLMPLVVGMNGVYEFVYTDALMVVCIAMV